METVICVFLSFILAGSLLAQEKERPRRRIKLPPETKGEMKILESKKGPVVDLAPETRTKISKEMFELSYVDAALEESIAPLLGELSGMNVIPHESIRKKKVTINARKAVGGSKAVNFIETALALQGIVAVERDEMTLLLLPADAKDGKLDFDPPVVAKREELKENQRVVDFVLKTDKLDAGKLAAFFKDRIKLLPIGRIDAGPDGKSIAIRERAAVIRRMLELVDAMEE